MRTLILSDIHANLTALEAVLADAAPFDQVWCLGDIVGYGPDPNECVERVKALPNLECVKGNHDAAILGEIDTWAFNDDARKSLDWLKTELDPDNLAWLSGLGEKLVLEKATLAHGSPLNPIWEYVMDVWVAKANLEAVETEVCLVGHTHIPCVFTVASDEEPSTRLSFLPVDEPFQLDGKSIINPGSVGQPRDYNPLASYLFFDDESDLPWYHCRVSYDIESVQERIVSVGLPLRHAARLAEGW